MLFIRSNKHFQYQASQTSQAKRLSNVVACAPTEHDSASDDASVMLLSLVVITGVASILQDTLVQCIKMLSFGATVNWTFWT